jgi:hypothetical protein
MEMRKKVIVAPKNSTVKYERSSYVFFSGPAPGPISLSLRRKRAMRVERATKIGTLGEQRRLGDSCVAIHIALGWRIKSLHGPRKMHAVMQFPRLLWLRALFRIATLMNWKKYWVYV